MMSLSFMIRSSCPSILTSVPDHLPNSTLSPAFTSRGTILPLSSRAPGPTAMISPCWGFSAAVSGMMMPPAVLVSLRRGARPRGRAEDGTSWDESSPDFRGLAVAWPYGKGEAGRLLALQ